MTPGENLLVSVTGPDAPGIAASLCAVLGRARARVLDMEQVTVHGRLLLSVEVEGDHDLRVRLERALGPGSLGPDVAVEVLALAVPASGGDGLDPPDRQLVTVLAPSLGADVLAGVFAAVAGAGANVERIVRLSRYPVESYELTVAAPQVAALRAALAGEAAGAEVDIAVQRAGLHRRARHLIVFDVDSTLLQGEVIDRLADRTGHADEVAAITDAAMAGELDFADALRKRVALLAGLPEGVLGEVAAEIVPTPGARTLVRTLRRLGYVTAAVSGGFTQVIEDAVRALGVEHVSANVLEVADGRLTGRLVGPIVDRRGKAAALARFARDAGIDQARTIAVGDGANDVDMLSAAGLGIAFNARDAARAAADTSLRVPYLDAVLFLLGISRGEVEAADRAGAGEAGREA
jgi:phosphoserine phosphatase